MGPFLGVPDRPKGQLKWQARIVYQGRTLTVGKPYTADEAARCYDRAAVRLLPRDGLMLNFLLANYVDAHGEPLPDAATEALLKQACGWLPAHARLPPHAASPAAVAPPPPAKAAKVATHGGTSTTAAGTAPPPAKAAKRAKLGVLNTMAVKEKEPPRGDSVVKPPKLEGATAAAAPSKESQPSTSAAMRTVPLATAAAPASQQGKKKRLREQAAVEPGGPTPKPEAATTAQPAPSGEGQRKGIGVAKTTSGKWRALIRVKGKPLNLGHYEDEQDAMRVYDKAAVRVKPRRGLKCNFPLQDYLDDDGELRHEPRVDAMLSEQPWSEPALAGTTKAGAPRQHTRRVGYRGVQRAYQTTKYKAHIHLHGRDVHLGCSYTEDGAGRLFDKFALRLRPRHKVAHKLNFPLSDYVDAQGELLPEPRIGVDVQRILAKSKEKAAQKEGAQLKVPSSPTPLAA